MKLFCKRLLVLPTILSFLLSNICYSSSIPMDAQHKLSPEFISPTENMPEGTSVVARIIMRDHIFNAIAIRIADHFIKYKFDKKTLVEKLKGVFTEEQEFLKWKDSLITDVYQHEGVVYIHFTKDDTKFRAEVWKPSGKNPDTKDVPKIGDYYIRVAVDPGRAIPKVDKDLKGIKASPSNPVIKRLIAEGLIAELYIDPVTNTLKANKVKWFDNYIPGITPQELYFGRELNVDQLFTSSEKAKIETWMKSNSVRGSPTKFRLALGAASIDWQGDIQHSKVSHAGIRDNAIYIGDVLLRELLRDENGSLFEEVTGKDELRHLKGLSHGTEEEYLKRLEMVEPSLKYLETVWRAISARDVYKLNTMFASAIDQVVNGNPSDLFRLLTAANGICRSFFKYPVEASYPVKKAVSLLSGEDKYMLSDVLKKEKFESFRSQILIDEILLMLDSDSILQEWINMHAANLIGRNIWQLSPEIWHEAGGLARVMQYHGVGMKDLIGEANVSLRHVEPYYQYRITEDKKEKKIDYTTDDISHPVRDLRAIDRFTVTVGKKKVNVEVSKGINSLGIETYLIRDVQENRKSYYTHSLYNYKDESDPESNPDIPTWEQFSVFYSKASLEFLKRIENKEREEKEQNGIEWKAPVVHLNDSQTALFSIYKEIELRKALEDKKKDDTKEVDRFLEEAVIAFTTHTYNNRQEYRLENGRGDRVLNFMGIPKEFRKYFVRKSWWGGKDWAYDIACSALRTSDWQGAVSRAHRDDVADADEHPDVDLGPDYDNDVRVIAVSNGDHREKSAEVFRNVLKKLYGSNVDCEHPEPEQVYEAKRLAKKELRLDEGQKYFTSWEDDGTGRVFNPDQMVISYSGRLVPEKVNPKRLFDRETILTLLKKGVQIAVWGNVQLNNTPSDNLAEYFEALIEEIKRDRQYTGRLIFVPRFKLRQQRELLAATDIQAQLSKPRTEAAGYTEADVSACGGLQFAPCRKDNGIGEGLLEQQGLPLDFKRKGAGNTLTAEEDSIEAYRKTILDALHLYNRGELRYYQATSVKLSRILEAVLTGAEYLRQFSYAVAKKEAGAKAKKKKKELEREMAEENSLFDKVFTPDELEDPAGYLSHTIARRVVHGETDKALTDFFTDKIVHYEDMKLTTTVRLLNKLLDLYAKDHTKKQSISDFIKGLIDKSLILSESNESARAASKGMQLMAGQALTIISWREREVAGTRDIRLTTEAENMVSNDKRGISYIDVRTLPEGLNEVKEEGMAGFFWRGTEGITKLGVNIVKEFIADPEEHEGAKNKLIMYLMDHGFLTPSEKGEVYTEGILTPLHETFFINDFIPGTQQTTSTGPGHFQGNNLDIKYVTAGSGVQVNVLYDADGKVQETLIQEVSEGDWCLALPGYVDYMINLGGLRFNDAAVSLDNDTARELNPWIDFDNIKLVEAAVKENAEYAPYIGALLGKEAKIVKVKGDVSDALAVGRTPADTVVKVLGSTWLATLVELFPNMARMDKKELFDVCRQFGNLYKDAIDNQKVYEAISLDESIEILKQSESLKTPSLGKAQGIETYIFDNNDFAMQVIGDEAKEAKLIRISIESINAAGSKNVQGFLQALQTMPNAYVELFSTDSVSDVSDNQYGAFGIEKKELPQSLHAEVRDRSNTITIMPVTKDAVFATGGNVKTKNWELGGMNPENTVVSPVGYNYDRAGIIRSILLGLRLSEISRNEDFDINSSFVSYTLAQYADLCLSLGEDAEHFDLTRRDLLNMARGNTKLMVQSLNKLIKLLPIMPINTEELRVIYEGAKETLIRA